jgi:hydroxyacyl-ACP dehydratase HTD2-like protein with hotdog domain
MMEMCRKELPARQLRSFDFKSARQIYDTGKFTISGNPSADGREAQLWALDQEGRVSMTATAKLA